MKLQGALLSQRYRASGRLDVCNGVSSEKAHVKHNESALPPIADIGADIDFCRAGPDPDIGPVDPQGSISWIPGWRYRCPRQGACSSSRPSDVERSARCRDGSIERRRGWHERQREPFARGSRLVAQQFPHAPPAPVTRSSSGRSPPIGPDHPLVTSIREQLHRERTARLALERRLGGLKQELAMLKAELGHERKVADMLERIQRLEASRTSLRSVS